MVYFLLSFIAAIVVIFIFLLTSSGYENIRGVGPTYQD